MPAEFEVIDNSLIVFCDGCGAPCEAKDMAFDERFMGTRCDCGKINLVSKRELKRRGHEQHVSVREVQ